jgi:CRISPR system Cascade subunit CasB
MAEPMSVMTPPLGGAQADPPDEKATGRSADEQLRSRDPDLAKYDEFADRVRGLCRESPGAQSALRAGLGKPVTEVPARVHAALLRQDTGKRGYADKERAYYAVAALIAARPRAQRLSDDPDTPGPGAEGEAPGAAAQAPPPSESGAGGARPAVFAAHGAVVTVFRQHGTSLGESFAVAVGRRSPDQLKAGPAESRLHLLVRQDLDGVHRMLPGVFRWLGSAGVAPDYACLLRDLAAWRYGRDAVSTRWLQEFYRSLHRQEAAAEKPPADPGA